jgi:hypothetical protein
MLFFPKQGRLERFLLKIKSQNKVQTLKKIENNLFFKTKKIKKIFIHSRFRTLIFLDFQYKEMILNYLKNILT